MSSCFEGTFFGRYFRLVEDRFASAVAGGIRLQGRVCDPSSGPASLTGAPSFLADLSVSFDGHTLTRNLSVPFKARKEGLFSL